MAGLLRVALKTILTYVDHILLPAVIDDACAAEGARHVLHEDHMARSGCRAHTGTTPFVAGIEIEEQKREKSTEVTEAERDLFTVIEIYASAR